MLFNTIEFQQIEKAQSQFMAKRRPPAQIRDQVDIGCRIDGRSLELYEIRPLWSDKSKIIESPFAKTTFIKSKNHWKIFWLRSNMKWYKFDPKPVVKTIDEFFLIVAKDEYGCFFG